MKFILPCLLLLAACQTALGQCCCDHCGCQTSCRKVCRVICEVQKVPKVTYGCECEEFCVPGPSVRSTVCDQCGHKHHVYTPTCGKVRTRTKMIKHETYEEKVVYRWVVENVCCDCAKKCDQPAAGAEQFAAIQKVEINDDIRPAAHEAALAHAETPAGEPAKPRTEEPAKISIGRLFESLVRRP